MLPALCIHSSRGRVDASRRDCLRAVRALIRGSRSRSGAGQGSARREGRNEKRRYKRVYRVVYSGVLRDCLTAKTPHAGSRAGKSAILYCFICFRRWKSTAAGRGGGCPEATTELWKPPPSLCTTFSCPSGGGEEPLPCFNELKFLL